MTTLIPANGVQFIFSLKGRGRRISEIIIAHEYMYCSLKGQAMTKGFIQDNCTISPDHELTVVLWSDIIAMV